MRGKLSWTVLAVVLCAAFLISVADVACACTFGERNQRFEYELGAQEFAVREGVMKAGERVSLVSVGGPVDVFIFNEVQYLSYTEVGRKSPGWRGAALQTELGTSSSQVVFTAPADGTYYYVIDNTVAGADPGDEAKSVTHDSLFPFGEYANEPFPFYLPLIIAGLVLFTLAVLTVFSYDGPNKRR